MSTGYGTLNFLEAIRVILALFAAIVSLWGVIHAHQGEMAIPRPIRAGITQRRRFQMGGFATIAILLGSQSLFASTVPEPAVMTIPTLTNGIVVMASLVVLLVLAMTHVIAWSSVEEIVGSTPLQPDAQEKLTEATDAGRALGHIARNELAVIATTFEVVLADPTLDPERRAEIGRALESVWAVAKQVEALHQQVRSLSEYTA